ncbi:hypothetical protein H4582DRAFT_1999023 [Lactarius indigo]|nr:hypothetical protein H4582DRAFT_1999023 [Lactarius indigo]
MALGKAAKRIFATPQHTPTSPTASQTTLDPTLAIADEKQFGLENFGNTCYANSVLQALYFCSPFRDLVIQSTDISAPPVPHPVSRPTHLPAPATTARRKSDRPKLIPDLPPAPTSPTPVIPSAPPTLFSALRSLYVYISKNPADKGAVSPRAFIDKLRDGNELFRGAMHQDAHEFLNYLLNKIVEEIQSDKHHRDKDVSSPNHSREDLSSSVATLVSNNAPTFTVHSDISQQSGTLVHRLFEGTLTSETRCLTCETVSSRDESFLDLSIDIEQNSSVTACLRQFSASEMLCQRNKFFCDSCCGLQEAEKRMKIKKLPNILALHLKRFKYQEELRKYIKLTYRVAFPFELRLFNTVDEVDDPDRLYELFGIVVHIGSGPHHGHYVTIVKGPHSWLKFDDDKIEPIKESEIPQFFGDAASGSGSAYVLYYQAVDLDPASLGLKPPALSVVSDLAAGTPVSAANAEANGGAVSDLTEPALPPGLGDSQVPTPVPVPAPAPAPVITPTPPPLLTTPSSPSLISPPLASVTLPSRKKSLPAIRIPGTSDSTTTTSPTTPNRTHGLFHTLRTSPGSSKIRPSTMDGVVSPRSPGGHTPPVPPVPSLWVNGKDLAMGQEKEKEREKEKGVDREREPQRDREKEEGRSSKEFDRKPSVWFKLWNAKSPKDEREKEKDKDKAKEKDVGAPPAPAIAPASSQATTSASTMALSSAPSQSDAGSSVSGASSLWRRSSARLGYHVKRLSATYSTTTLGELDGTGSPPGPGSASSSHHHHHHHHHHLQSPPPPLPAVPQTPQGFQPDAEPPSPTTSASGSHSPAPTPARRPPPLASTSDALLPPSTSDLSDYDEDNDHEDHDDDRGNGDGDGHANGHHKQQHRRRHRWARARTPAELLAGLQRGRPHSMHGSGSGTPRERSVSPHPNVEPSPLSASAAEGHAVVGLTPPANGAPSSSSSSSVGKGKEREREKDKDKDKEPGLRRAARKLSLNAPLFSLGIGLGIGGREKDRERDAGKKDDSKKAHKIRTPSTTLGSGSAALASAAR